MKAEFFGTCVENPFNSVEELSLIIENAREISITTFFKKCDIDEESKKEMKLYGKPSFSFWKYKNIYFYTWSCIEHFYI